MNARLESVKSVAFFRPRNSVPDTLASAADEYAFSIGGSMKPAVKIQWALIVVTAFAIEATLFAILIPVRILFGMQVFLVAVPIGVTVITYLLTVWFGRRIQARFGLHGLLIGLVATLIYMGLLVSQGA